MKKVYLLFALLTFGFGCGDDNKGPVTPSKATGEYALKGILELDTCSGLAGEDELDFGTWLLAKTTEKFYFMDMKGFELVSDDGYNYERHTEAGGWTCVLEVFDIAANLAFDHQGLTGEMDLQYQGVECYSFETGDVEDTSCDRHWTIYGDKQ